MYVALEFIGFEKKGNDFHSVIALTLVSKGGSCGWLDGFFTSQLTV